MILPIYGYGNMVLRGKGEFISKEYPKLDELINNMFETMYTAEGVGLAAQQIGLNIKLFIIDADIYADEHPECKNFKKIFINAEIIEESGNEWYYNEGCLSFPGIREDVSRKSNLKIKYFDSEFKEYTEEYNGILARIIQHEFDHNQGVFFIDKINPLKKVLIKNKLNNIITGKINVKYPMKFANAKKK
ncbi:MAG: peptide deformylase [Bacteroidales bacterium]|nr:peptide deformylase [Bacteroidales bacterium]